MKDALLFDLDETLVVEEPAAVAATARPLPARGANAFVLFASRHQLVGNRVAHARARDERRVVPSTREAGREGLGDYFAAVVVSAELGVGKPDARIFRHALSRLDCRSERAVMVGDSLSRDVDGAVAAGLGAVWVNRHGSARPERRADLPEVSALSGLPAVLSDWDSGFSS